MIDLGTPEPEAGAEPKATAGFIRSIWQIMYPGRTDVPNEGTVLAQLKDFITQKDRQIHDAVDLQRDFDELVQENIDLKAKLGGT